MAVEGGLDGGGQGAGLADGGVVNRVAILEAVLIHIEDGEAKEVAGLLAHTLSASRVQRVLALHKVACVVVGVRACLGECVCACCRRHFVRARTKAEREVLRKTGQHECVCVHARAGNCSEGRSDAYAKT